MLRKIRVALAAIVFTLLTLLFLDFTGTLQAWFGWLAKIQLVPAILAFNAGVLIFLILLTLIFGRVYCSVICPLGVCQDIISWFAGKTKRNRFTYSRPLSWLRYVMLAIFIVALSLGLSVIVALFEPYSAFGRIASELLAPIYLLGNNLLAFFAEKIDSYAFYSVDIWIKSGVTLAVAAITLVVIGFLSWRNGRTYCNTVCPVGTVLGWLSKISIMRPFINVDKCTNCRLCEKNCKASCIDIKTHAIDYSRCVACMDCIGKCKFDAMHYKCAFAKKDSPQKDVAEKSDDSSVSRRNFLSLTALLTLTTTLKAQEKAVQGGLATIEDKKIPKRTTHIVPPGAQSIKNVERHCTACQLCISACPNKVLRPSTALTRLMQPEMAYEQGYCRPECTRCSEVCPTGAILKITRENKVSTQIGRAVWIADNCIANTQNVRCNACERHCPVAAIHLVAVDPNDRRSKQLPVVSTEMCIGCGACEYYCPARPFSAMYVEGNEVHRTI
ncbi:MAG: 4Fe-4S binding protein [Culturomica sp.]|jgi:ferredoxin|nr:4Fe-4S binding protein [Culturomica sp.]